MVFSALAGASPTINQIIGFRAGWGVGNALFIATSLAVIVASASGGFAGAIVLYETALGVGIAIGPLLGGTLGEISWRGPFYGVAVLMAIALIATVVLVEPTPKPAHKTSLSAPLRALRHRGLLTMSLTALCYNWGFFTVLGYAPFPMALSPIRLGLVFTGWGIFVAAGRLVIAINIHFPFFIAAGAILAGIAILSTARSLLTEAERVQAEQVSAATAPDATRGVILAAVDNSPMADLVTETAARLAAADGRAVYVVHAQEDVTASDVATDGEDLEDSRALVRKQLDLLAARQVPARGEVLRHAPVTAWPGGWSPSTPPPSGPTRS